MTKELYRVSTNNGKYTLVLDEKYDATALRYGEQWPGYEGVKIQSIAKHLASGLNQARETLVSVRDQLIVLYGEDLANYPTEIATAISTLNAEIRSINGET